nr:MAG TPA: hypothetical protein [Caudoviricetes sp.]
MTARKTFFSIRAETLYIYNALQFSMVLILKGLAMLIASLINGIWKLRQL